jgi:transcriptional regulator with XRE-family HTH domain
MSEVAYIGPGGRERRPRPLLRTLLGDILRRNRLEQRRTLADVARAARVSLPYLSELERGRKEASSEVLAAVCGALRIELSDVLTAAGRDLANDRAPVLRLPAGQQHHRLAPPVGRPQRLAPPAPRRSGDVVLLAA